MIFVLLVQELQDRVRKVVGKESKEELMKVRKEIVDFHGEMVLLENYSALNYTGINFMMDFATLFLSRMIYLLLFASKQNIPQRVWVLFY